MAFIGSQITFAVVVTDTSAAEADPTSVRFFLREAIDSTELEWTYDAAPVAGTHYPAGANPIVRDSQGNYSLAWVTRKPERHTGFWRGSGNVNQTAQTTVLVRHSEIEAVG